MNRLGVIATQEENDTRFTTREWRQSTRLQLSCPFAINGH